MAIKRNDKKWQCQFEIALDLLKLSEKYSDNSYMLEQYAIAIRNPIVFDNQVKETELILDYKIPNPNGDKETLDHLIGMSNIVLYIIKSKLYEKWETKEDFIQTLKALQVMVVCPKKVNDSKGFKDWLSKYDSVDNTINWNYKLKENGYHYLINDKGELKSVDVIWSEWNYKYKKYLV